MLVSADDPETDGERGAVRFTYSRAAVDGQEVHIGVEAFPRKNQEPV
jgi:hypothetical protein